jgi:L,D-transpeptidase ErfK/SrfK
VNHVQLQYRQYPIQPEDKIEKNKFSILKKDDVIGRPAVIRLKKGDTLPDIARHFGLGIKEISAANPDVDVWVPDGGRRIILPLSFILPDAHRRGIVINLAAMRLFQFRGKNNSESLIVWTYPVGIGSAERPTPLGETYVKRKIKRPTWHVPASIADDHRKKGDPLPEKVPPGPLNPLGEYALYLNIPGYLIHGTNKPSSIGLKATNGCMRLYPEDVKKLYENTPVKTPVCIVNQPYLIGQRDGVFYLEVHPTLDDSNAVELEKTYAKLRKIEKQWARKVNWRKVEEAVAEARGIPVPILELREGSVKEAAEFVEVTHPGKFHGEPEVPELNMEAWYVLAAEEREESDALRTAAMINHQGPPIPARVLPTDNIYRVVAGPFGNVGEAEDAAKRLKIDLGIEGKLIEPVRGKQ